MATHHCGSGVWLYLAKFLLVIGALTIVRVFRETTRDDLIRFVFSKVAVLVDGELRVHFASNRPSSIINPTFKMTVKTVTPDALLH